MPIVNIELKFNDQGAVTGARNLTALSEAADKAQKSVSGVGDRGAASVSSLGKNAEVATARIQGLATQILALVGAYKALQAASAFVSRTFDFSSNLEDSQIAIASVLGATNKIADKAAATPQSQTESLLQSKADLLNQQAYQGRTDWTAQSVQSGILDAGMTVDQWYQRYGINEGVSTSYTSTSSGKSDAEVLAEKAASLNASGYGGKSDWTAASVAQGMSDLGITVSQWYDRYGKAEGFATGGITPTNQPFWVGENGPELVVSPQQWGVINNTDSMALMRGMSGGGNIDSGSIVAAINNMNDTLRQLLTKTDRIMADQSRIRNRIEMFAQVGVTIAA